MSSCITTLIEKNPYESADVVDAYNVHAEKPIMLLAIG